MDELVTISEAAARIGCSMSSLRRWERRGLVLPLRDYRGWRHYRTTDLQRLRNWRRPRATAAAGPAEPTQSGNGGHGDVEASAA